MVINTRACVTHCPKAVRTSPRPTVWISPVTDLIAVYSTGRLSANTEETIPGTEVAPKTMSPRNAAPLYETVPVSWSRAERQYVWKPEEMREAE